MDVPARHAVERLQPVVGFQHVVALALEGDGNGADDLAVVVHDQYGFLICIRHKADLLSFLIPIVQDNPYERGDEKLTKSLHFSGFQNIVQDFGARRNHIHALFSYAFTKLQERGHSDDRETVQAAAYAGPARRRPAARCGRLRPDRQRAEAAEASAAVTDWGLSFQQEGAPPVANATSDYLKNYRALYVGDPEKKEIYITFDAGFENGNTAQILDALKKHNVKATFFLVGNYLETQPELVKRMVQEGHTVGNHTYSHPDMSKISDTESFCAELQKNEALFEAITGQAMPKLYRPPQGKFCESNLQMACDLGYSTVFWSSRTSTGTRTTSRRRSRPSKSSCRASTPAPSYCSTALRARTRRSSTSF